MTKSLARPVPPLRSSTAATFGLGLRGLAVRAPVDGADPHRRQGPPRGSVSLTPGPSPLGHEGVTGRDGRSRDHEEGIPLDTCEERGIQAEPRSRVEPAPCSSLAPCAGFLLDEAASRQG
jgi:hypothetical protein